MSKSKSLSKTTDKWRDSLGQWFEAGDFMAVATISGRSPQMVIAQVVKINTHDAKGLPYIVQWGNGPAVADDGYRGYGKPPVPTVTVTATPIHDGRNFHRSKGKWSWDKVTGKYTHDGRSDVRDSTYRIIGNLVKLNEDQVIELLIKKEKDAEAAELAKLEEELAESE